MTAAVREDEPIIFPGQLTVDDLFAELATTPDPTALED
jgi:sulfur carrier protein ThiS